VPGTTSYAPTGLDVIALNFDALPDSYDGETDFTKAYKKEAYKEFESVLTNGREIPPPGVLYELVNVENARTTEGVTTMSENYSQYHFQVYGSDMITINRTPEDIANQPTKTYEFPDNKTVTYVDETIRKVTLRDRTASVGSLKKVTLFDRQGRKLHETRSKYLYDEAEDIEDYKTLLESRFSSQGVIEETFTDARFAKVDGDYILQGVLSKRETLPNIRVGEISTDFKTGISTETKVEGFDFYSGQAVRQVSNDGYGNTYLSVTTPAYRAYPMMGQMSKGGKNMLTQTASEAVFKVSPTSTSTKLGVVSASVQTWSDKIAAVELSQSRSVQNGIWRKHAAFAYIGENSVELRPDGLYPADNFQAFTSWNWPNGLTPGWQKQGNITLYDVNSHALEAADLNEKYAATHMMLDQGNVLATTTNARYDQVAVSGAEEFANDMIGARVKKGSVNAFLSPTFSHTGKLSLRLWKAEHGFESQIEGTPLQKLYVMSVWVHESNAAKAALEYQFSAESVHPLQTISFVPDPKKKAGPWYLWEYTIPVPEVISTGPVDFTLNVKIRNSSSVAEYIYLDDFRLCPYDAAVVSYVYNEWGELTHILDATNKFTRFEYDKMGRLISTHAESFEYDVKQVSSQNYHYGVQPQ
jgi:YD repeat-containing protein